MFEFIGLVVVWWLSWILIGMLINGFRLRSTDQKINDDLSAFLIGVAIGPIALFPPLDNKTLGGLIGTAAFIAIYLSL